MGVRIDHDIDIDSFELSVLTSEGTDYIYISRRELEELYENLKAFLGKDVIEVPTDA